MVKDFLLLPVESMLGVALSDALLVPTTPTIIQNPRVDNLLDGWGMLLYGWNQRHACILQSLFFPSDTLAWPNFTLNSEAK